MGNHLVSTIRDTQLYLFQTIPHSIYLPFPILDLLGAIRLSIFVDQYVRSKSKIPDDKVDEGGRRPTFLQEAFGIAVLVFGGETFLGEPCRKLVGRCREMLTWAKRFSICGSGFPGNPSILASIAQRPNPLLRNA